MTARQQQVLDYLRALPEGEWASQDEIAKAVGSTKRGIGNVLTRLLNDRLVTCQAPGWEWEWRARS